ncbi:MAG: hypothetical protein JNL70_15410 [Saprospiraceae bacterium]|nr:hypothetical protein [Saprospiraceae bacterium]
MRKLHIKLSLILSLLAFVVKADCVFEQGLEAKEFGVGLMLTWRTSSEINNQTFIVEKSENGTTFSNVGNVKANGTTRDKKAYNFLDVQATAKKIFYRLKQVDFDGTYSFSEVLVVNKKLDNNLIVVQMTSETTSRLFACMIDAMVEGNATLKLQDASGKQVWQGTQKMVAGLNNITVDLSAHREGTYKLVVSMGKEDETLVIRKSLDEVESKINVATNKRALGPNR